MVLGIGPWPWPISEFGYDNIPRGDEWNLRRWLTSPYLAYAWHPTVAANWVKDSWGWLSDHGWEEACLRLWLPGSSDNPCNPPSPKDTVDGLFDRVNDCIIANGSIEQPRGIWLYCAQLDNEPNLEHRTMTVAEYEKWMQDTVAYWRYRFPSLPIGSPPLAQWAYATPDAPNIAPWEDWVAMIVRNAHLFDYLCVHYYWGELPHDDEVGFIGSPEWWHARVPDKDIIVSECGNKSVQHQIYDVLARWTGYSWLRSYHIFVLSSEGFPKWNFTGDTGNVVHELIRLWRKTRLFPRGATTTPPTPPPAGNVDVTALTNVMHRYWQTYERLIAVKDKEIHEILGEMHAEIADYKRIVGIS